MCKAALATVALLALSLARAEAQVDLTEIPVPFLYPGDPLEPHAAGILFQVPGLAFPSHERTGVYRSSGTAATTRRLVVPGRPVHELLGYRGHHVFLNAARTEWAPREVFSLELQSARAQRLVAGRATYGRAAGSGFFFVLESGAAPGLYRTDGTPEGTRLVFAGPVADVASIGRAVLFLSPLEGGQGHALYRAGGTMVERLGEFPLVVPFTPFDYFDPFPAWKNLFLVPLGERAAFLQRGAGADALWISDGTVGGTALIHAAADPVAYSPAPCGGDLLFFRGFYPFEVWATDGTSAGTRSLASIPDLLQPSFRVADALGICYFLSGSGGPAQLWRTDLTPAGTAPVASVDYASGLPAARATGARGRVFFPKHGELWVSDGTPAGTNQVAASLGGAPTHLVHAAGRVFFATYADPFLPSSLWVVDLPPALLVEDAEAIEKRNGVGVMTFLVRLSRPGPTEVVVHFETEGGTAEPGEDFVAAYGSLRFSPGERLKLVRVSVTGDGVREGAEHFKFRLTDPAGAEIERGLATGTIRDPGSDFPGPRR